MFVFCSVMLVILLWVIPVIIRKCRNACSRERRRDEAQEDAFERAFQRMLYANEAEFVRAILQQGMEPVVVDRQESRKTYIECVLMKKTYREYKIHGQKSPEKEPVESKQEIFKNDSEASEADVVEQQPVIACEENDADSLSPRTDHEDLCAICLCKFENDDEVAWSQNRRCNHVFHRECIAEWLQKKEECPCCRSFFLHFESNPTSNENQNNNTADISRSAIPHVAPPGVDYGDDESMMPPGTGSAGVPMSMSVLDVFREMGRVYRLMQIAEQEGRNFPGMNEANDSESDAENITTYANQIDQMEMIIQDSVQTIHQQEENGSSHEQQLHHQQQRAEDVSTDSRQHVLVDNVLLDDRSDNSCPSLVYD